MSGVHHILIDDLIQYRIGVNLSPIEPVEAIARGYVHVCAGSVPYALIERVYRRIADLPELEVGDEIVLVHVRGGRGFRGESEFVRNRRRGASDSFEYLFGAYFNNSGDGDWTPHENLVGDRGENRYWYAIIYPFENRRRQ